MSASAIAVRKPAAIAGAKSPEICLCGHSKSDHDGACALCECRAFQLRRCLCGHVHVGACSEPGCSCKRYRADSSPEFLLRMGIGAGEWQFITISQLRFLMRPEHPHMVRVWACGMVHSIGQRRRLAVKVGPNGEKTPLSPSDILDELNALDPLARLDRHHIRRAMEDLERLGAARRSGKLRNNVRLFFYGKILDFGGHVWPPNSLSGPATDSKDNQLRPPQISHICGQVVKTFRAAIRRHLEATVPGAAVTPELEAVIERVLDPVLEHIEKAYENVLRILRVPAQEVNDGTGERRSGSADLGVSSTTGTPEYAAGVGLRDDPICQPAQSTGVEDGRSCADPSAAGRHRAATELKSSERPAISRRVRTSGNGSSGRKNEKPRQAVLLPSSQLVVASDHQTQSRNGRPGTGFVASTDPQTEDLVVRISSPLNKEDSIISSIKACMHACPLAGLRDLFPDDHLTDDYLAEIDAAIRKEAGDYEPSDFLRFVYNRQRRKPIGPGLLPALARDFTARANGDGQQQATVPRRTDGLRAHVRTWLRILNDDPTPDERQSVLRKLAEVDPAVVEEVRSAMGGTA